MDAPCFVGIDASKDHPGVRLRPQAESFRLANDPAGIAALAGRRAALAPAGIVLEAAGGYEALLVGAPAAAGLAPALVNPRRARDFAKATGRLAKAGRIGACALAHSAEALRPQPKPLPDEAARAFAALLARRRQLVGMRAAEQNRLGTAPTAAVRRDAQGHVAWRARLDKELGEAVRASPLWRAEEGPLRGVPGMGPTVARCLRAGLPELGPLSGRQAAAPAGLAPRDRDSGAYRGRRGIGGGRAGVRSASYRASLPAATTRRRAGPTGVRGRPASWPRWA